MKPTRRLLLLLLAVFLIAPMAVGPAAALDLSRQAQFAIPIMVVNTSFLNVRTGPGAHYSVLVTVVGGMELPVLGVAADGVWYLVATPVGNGWLNVDYVIPRGDFRNVPEIDVNFVVAPVIVAYTPVSIGLPGVVADGQGGGAAPFSTVERFRAQINVEAVNLRTAPADEASVIRVLFGDETVDYAMTGRAHDKRNVEWLSIHVPGVGTGWVEAPKVRVRLSARYRDVLTIVADSVNVFAQPGAGSLNIRPLQHGDEAFLLDITPDGQLVKIELPTGEVGWVPFSAVVTRTGTTTDDLSDSANAGQGGSLVPAAVAPVVIPPVVSVPVPQLETPRAIVNTGNLNIRSGPGAHFTSVAVVPGGTELAVVGLASDEVWYLVQGAFGQGWVNKDFVIFRGVFDNVPVIPYDVAASVAVIATPVAVVSVPVTLYAAPGIEFAQIGVLYGPSEAALVARTADGAWVQVTTPQGYGWVVANEVVLRGDLSVVPVV